MCRDGTVEDHLRKASFADAHAVDEDAAVRATMHEGQMYALAGKTVEHSLVEAAVVDIVADMEVAAEEHMVERGCVGGVAGGDKHVELGRIEISILMRIRSTEAVAQGGAVGCVGHLYGWAYQPVVGIIAAVRLAAVHAALVAVPPFAVVGGREVVRPPASEAHGVEPVFAPW